MKGTARRLAAVAGAASLGLAGGTAWAQGPAPTRPAFRYTLEGYVAQYSLDDRIGTSKQNIGGGGLRLTFNRPEVPRAGRSIVDRATGNVFATYTPRQGTPSVSTLHYGVESDFPVLQHPAGGVLDPFFAFGLGLFHTSRENLVSTTSRGRINRTDFAFTPALGTRVALARGTGLRGDVRMPVVFGTSTTANFVGEVGVYVSF
jgi:hypothetical protein